MIWRLLAAILVAGTVSSFTDWLFMGVLFSDRYAVYPDTWWPRSGPSAERTAIIVSSGLGYITAAGIVLLCWLTGIHSLRSSIVVAALAALAGPVVIVPTNGLWVKIDPAVTFAHTIGYMARFLIAGIAAGIALSI